MSRHLDGSMRRSSRPPLPNLHIPTGEKASPMGSSALDSGYYSAMSARQSSNAAPEQSPSVSELAPTPDVSIFANTDPFEVNKASSGPDRPNDESSPSPVVQPPPSRRNTKKLSLTSLDPRPTLRPAPSNLSMKSVAPNTIPMSLPPSPHLPHRKLSIQPAPLITVHEPSTSPNDSFQRGVVPSRRRSSVMSLPPPTTYAKPPRTKYNTGRRAIEDDMESDAYAKGPLEILPGVWLGAEDNASDWDQLAERQIGAVLNVAKEVVLPYEADSNVPQPWNQEKLDDEASRGRQYPPNEEFGRPEITYLHLPWSHGQNDLVKVGFVQAMSFIDRCRDSKIGVLIHCQCGISRSATLAIAYVMRSAQDPTAPPQLAKLKTEGMQGAYDFVKSKSSTIGPNMSLIYQLLEYERHLSPGPRGPGSDTSVDSAEAEWTRQRMEMDRQEQEDMARTESPDPLAESTTAIEAAEARELDLRMQVRRENRSSSRASSVVSTTSETQDAGSGAGAWKSRFNNNGPSLLHSNASSRTRGLSVGSELSFASGRSSAMSDALVLEEDEDAEENPDSPWSRSRKDSAEANDVGDETFVQLPPLGRAPSTVLLSPLPPPARKRESLASLRSNSGLSQTSSGRSSPAFSRRSSELGPPPSARPEQTSFFPPPPSARPDQTSFSSSQMLPPPPSAGFGQTSFGFPSRRRSADPSSSMLMGPPPVRSTRLSTLSNASRLGPLDTVPSSPVRGSDQDTDVPPSPTATRVVEKKGKPKPLALAVQPKTPSLELEPSLEDTPPRKSHSSRSSTSSFSSGLSASGRSSLASPSTSRKTPSKSNRRFSRPPQLNVVAGSATPHQTLFIFPASPQRFDSVLSPDGTEASYPVPSTPSTMLLTTTNLASPTSAVPGADWRSRGASISSTMSSASSASASSINSLASTRSSSSRRQRVTALPSGLTPTIAAFRQKAFGTTLPPSTPTLATAHVEARGWVGPSGSSEKGKRSSTDLLSPLSPSTPRPAAQRQGFRF